MPFQKGIKKHPESGMKPGQKSTKTLAWERVGEYITGEGANRYVKVLRRLDDDKFCAEYRAVLEYFKPKLQRAEAEPLLEVKQEPVSNTFSQFIEQQVIELDNDLKWKDKNLAEELTSKPSHQRLSDFV